MTDITVSSIILSVEQSVILLRKTTPPNLHCFESYCCAVVQTCWSAGALCRFFMFCTCVWLSSHSSRDLLSAYLVTPKLAVGVDLRAGICPSVFALCLNND